MYLLGLSRGYLKWLEDECDGAGSSPGRVLLIFTLCYSPYLTGLSLLTWRDLSTKTRVSPVNGRGSCQVGHGATPTQQQANLISLINLYLNFHTGMSTWKHGHPQTPTAPPTHTLQMCSLYTLLIICCSKLALHQKTNCKFSIFSLYIS